MVKPGDLVRLKGCYSLYGDKNDYIIDKEKFPIGTTGIVASVTEHQTEIINGVIHYPISILVQFSTVKNYVRLCEIELVDRELV